MDTAPLSEIKKELKLLSPQQLQEIITRLARFKKENKELLSYLLFESFNQQAFIQGVKQEIDLQFQQLNRSSYFLAKKTLRKTLRTTNKYIRFSGSKEVELELLIYFCLRMKNANLRINSNRVVQNIYQNQVKRVKKIHSALHEDLQSDFEEEINKL
ncbi:MAG: hypothetical protein ACOC0R_03835 [Mariniphaga sp.]